MISDPLIAHVFGRFQNLNLLALIDDLRSGRCARGNWLSGYLLCPVVHGMAGGGHVGELQSVSQFAGFDRSCVMAAESLGADSRFLTRFVTLWDDGALTPDWLQDQLECLWQERLEDAIAMQRVLTPSDWDVEESIENRMATTQ
jgi:hypothetical protein